MRKIVIAALAGDAHGFGAKCLGYAVFEQFATGLVEKFQPACEQPALNPLDPEMHGHRVAFVASARQHHRRPEVVHRCEMRSPVTRNGALEDRCKLRIGTNLGANSSTSRRIPSSDI
jgi:hypothetical protein